MPYHGQSARATQKPSKAHRRVRRRHHGRAHPPSYFTPTPTLSRRQRPVANDEAILHGGAGGSLRQNDSTLSARRRRTIRTSGEFETAPPTSALRASLRRPVLAACPLAVSLPLASLQVQLEALPRRLVSPVRTSSRRWATSTSSSHWPASTATGTNTSRTPMPRGEGMKHYVR